jgi:hypothetical protein
MATTIIVSGAPTADMSATTIEEALMESDNTSSQTPKRRQCKPQGPEYEYFDILSARENGKGWRIKCKFCGSREMNSHAPRMRKHLVTKCEGNVPEEVKNKFRNHRPVYTKSEADGNQRKSGRKRTIIEFDNDMDSDDDTDLGNLTNLSKSEKARAAELLSGLLMPSKPKSEETTFSKKPLKMMTNEDFEREQKELAIKKARMEIKVMEDQSRFWTKMSHGIDKILKAADLYIESKTRALDDNISQVHYLSTNHDGSAVLTAGYTDQIGGQ